MSDEGPFIVRVRGQAVYRLANPSRRHRPPDGLVLYPGRWRMELTIPGPPVTSTGHRSRGFASRMDLGRGAIPPDPNARGLRSIGIVL